MTNKNKVDMKKKVIIVDDKNKIIGAKARGTLTKEDIYRVSALWITNSRGDVFLARRGFNKSHNPGKWGPAVAGTIDEGDTYESNIIREAQEEIGLSNIKLIKGPMLERYGEYHYFAQWFFATIDKPADEFTIQKEEVAEIKWFSKDELSKALQDHPEEFLESIKLVNSQGITSIY